MRVHFASDNNAGVHPEVLRAIANANEAHAAAYGGDEHTARTTARLRSVFGNDAEVFFVFNGTAANTLALTHLTRSHEAIICAATAHINVDECGALEAVGGRKLLSIEAANGKVTPDALARFGDSRGDVHRVQARVLSISQATEYGTVYTLAELRALCAAAHDAGLLVHVDGARLANAAVALGCGLGEMTRDVGVDVVTFGGTKNGLLGAEAVIFFDASQAEGFAFLRKQMMQLGSKMRFLAAQFDAILTDELWKRSAAHANAMAALLAHSVRGLPGLTVTQSVETNAVFARIPRAAIHELQRTYRFNVWNPASNEVRWMTAFDTTEESVRKFAGAVADVLSPSGKSRAAR